MTDPQDERLRLAPYLPRLVLGWPHSLDGPSWVETGGSLAFVDIAGFTRMSERLARHGKIGAEEVSDVIGTSFSTLLASAYAEDGQLLKFGGDAVLLFFGGAEHAERACRAAFEMRRTLARMGSLQTAAGRVALRMHVGIHSGRCQFFLVGDRHHELLVTGPTATEAVTMGNAAEAGEIVVSRGTAEHLEPGTLGAPKGPGILLRRPPRWRQQARGSLAALPMRVDPADCIPEAVRQYLQSGGREPVHRPVTVGFLHFGDVDRLASRGAEALVGPLDELVRLVQEAAAVHGVSFLGTDVDADGGKITMAAGAPFTSEEDEERMLRTARAIVGGEPPLPVRIGLNRGHVFSGDIGPPYRRTYTVMGDAVNLSARLMAAAGDGQIMASRSVLDRARTEFEEDPVELTVKGKSGTVSAAVVGAPRGRRTRERGGRARIVGREMELAMVMEGLDSARRGRGRVIDLVGEPGMGKTAIVEEILSAAQGMPVLMVQTDAYRPSSPYAVFPEPLRHLLEIEPGLGPDPALERLREAVARADPSLVPWLPLLAVPLGLEAPATPEVEALEERFRGRKLQEVTVRFLGATLDRPSVLVFEDTHAMDQASVELLQHLAERTGDFPWLVCVTRRQRYADDSALVPNAVAIRLRELPPAATAAIIAETSGEAPLLPHQIDALARRSGGNPLFIHELLAAARDAPDIEHLPDSVEATVLARIDHLGAADRELLRRLAVLGRSFEKRLVREVIEPLPGDGVWERLAEFVVQGAERIQFRHALIRDVAYEALPYRVRRDLHGRVARVLERWSDADLEAQAALISLHFARAERHDETWRYARMAAERASRLFANAEAAALLERAMVAARGIPELASGDVGWAMEALGDVLERMGDYERAERTYRRARRVHAGQAVPAARLMLKESQLARRFGRYAVSLRRISTARRTLEGAPGEEALALRVHLPIWYGSVLQQQGRSREALRWLERGVEEARSAGDDGALAHGYYLLDWAAITSGSFVDDTRTRKALAIYERTGDLVGQANALNNMGGFAFEQGRWEEAIALYRRSEEARRKTGDAVNAAFGSGNVAEILIDQGHLAEGEAALREAMRVWRAAGYRTGVAWALMLLGLAAARGGRHEQSASLLAEARSAYRDLGSEPDVLAVDVRAAGCALLRGETGEALRLADDALARAGRMRVPPAIGVTLDRIRGSALLERDGGLHEGMAILRGALERARDGNIPYEAARILLALARGTRGAGGDARDLEIEAATILERLGVVSVPGLPGAEGS